jgi:hypothetical protein
MTGRSTRIALTIKQPALPQLFPRDLPTGLSMLHFAILYNERSNEVSLQVSTPDDAWPNRLLITPGLYYQMDGLVPTSSFSAVAHAGEQPAWAGFFSCSGSASTSTDSNVVNSPIAPGFDGWPTQGSSEIRMGESEAYPQY